MQGVEIKREVSWTGVALIGGYIAAQLVADVSAVKLLDVGGVVLPAGTFIFALTFTLRDLIHRRYGGVTAQRAITMAVVANIFLSLYTLLMVGLRAPVWWEGQAAFAAVFSVVPRITIASIVAEWVSETVDTFVYEVVWGWGASPAVRVLASNAVGLVLDSILFTLIAFGAAGMWQVVTGQVIFKALVTIASVWMIGLVKGD